MTWWEEELRRLQPGLLRSVRRHSSFEPGLESDIVAQAMLEISQRLAAAPGKFPASWFASEAPSSADVARFQALARLVCKRRVYDRLRQHYAARDRVPLPGPTVGISAEQQASDREILRLVAGALDDLPVEDRELIIRGMERAHGELALSAAERMRLSRLRRHLTDVVDAAIHGSR
jgi:hypothetical protein